MFWIYAHPFVPLPVEKRRFSHSRWYGGHRGIGHHLYIAYQHSHFSLRRNSDWPCDVAVARENAVGSPGTCGHGHRSTVGNEGPSLGFDFENRFGWWVNWLSAIRNH